MIATIPFNLNGDTIIFSAPFKLFSNSPIFTYQLQADTFGVDNDLILGSSTAPASIHEPATWAMMLVGFAGLGIIGRRVEPLRLTRPRNADDHGAVGLGGTQSALTHRLHHNYGD